MSSSLLSYLASAEADTFFFSKHCRSKKHRRFALNPKNWLDLDELFNNIARPILPELLELYDAAGCEVPSDIEASDDSDSEMEDEDEGEHSDFDSGFVSHSDLYGRAEKGNSARRNNTISPPTPTLDGFDLDRYIKPYDDGEGEDSDDSDEASTSEEEDALESEEERGDDVDEQSDDNEH